MSRTPEDRATLLAAQQIKSRERREHLASRPAKVATGGEGQRKPRVRDNAYLAWLRRQPCAVRGLHGHVCAGRIEAAHLRAHKPGELPTGLQRKPDDNRANPLCSVAHRAQHGWNELKWWQSFGLDPFLVCERNYDRFLAGLQGSDRG